MVIKGDIVVFYNPYNKNLSNIAHPYFVAASNEAEKHFLQCTTDAIRVLIHHGIDHLVKIESNKNSKDSPFDELTYIITSKRYGLKDILLKQDCRTKPIFRLPKEKENKVFNKIQNSKLVYLCSKEFIKKNEDYIQEIYI